MAGGPRAIDPQTRQQAINFVSSLRAGGGTNPWNGLWNSLQNKDVTQIILYLTVIHGTEVLVMEDIKNMQTALMITTKTLERPMD